jgi:hypothetical protein
MYIIHHIIPTVLVVSIVLYRGRLHERHRYFTTILGTEQTEHDGSFDYHFALMYLGIQLQEGRRKTLQVRKHGVCHVFSVSDEQLPHSNCDYA